MPKPEIPWDEWREEWGEPETAEMTIDPEEEKIWAKFRFKILPPITFVFLDPPE